MNRFRKPVQIKRAVGAGYVDGYYQQGTPQELTIMASVQPVKPSDLLLLPEGRRNSMTFRLYTDDTLVQVVEGKDYTQPDRAVIDGDDYEIHGCAHWDNGLIPHRKYLAVRVQP